MGTAKTNNIIKKQEKYSIKECCKLISNKLLRLSPNELCDLYLKLYKPKRSTFKFKNNQFILTKYTKTKPEEGAHIVVGGYYELPDKRVAYIYGCNGMERTVRYFFDSDEHGVTSWEEVKKWKIRNDLRDFPNATDPKIPYVFDLYWDIKRESELKELIKTHSYNWLKDKGVVSALFTYFPKFLYLLKNEKI